MAPELVDELVGWFASPDDLIEALVRAGLRMESLPRGDDAGQVRAAVAALVADDGRALRFLVLSLLVGPPDGARGVIDRLAAGGTPVEVRRVCGPDVPCLTDDERDRLAELLGPRPVPAGQLRPFLARYTGPFKMWLMTRTGEYQDIAQGLLAECHYLVAECPGAGAVAACPRALNAECRLPTQEIQPGRKPSTFWNEVFATLDNGLTRNGFLERFFLHAQRRFPGLTDDAAGW